jgi:hypothetical protein
LYVLENNETQLQGGRQRTLPLRTEASPICSHTIVEGDQKTLWKYPGSHHRVDCCLSSFRSCPFCLSDVPNPFATPTTQPRADAIINLKEQPHLFPERKVSHDTLPAPWMRNKGGCPGTYDDTKVDQTLFLDSLSQPMSRLNININSKHVISRVT